MSGTISSSISGPVDLATIGNPATVEASGTVTSTGTLSGIISTASATLFNFGLISSQSGLGVSLASSGTITNDGSISGDEAIQIRGGGLAQNDATGTITATGTIGHSSGSGAGIFITGGTGSINNAGLIDAAAYGVALGAGGMVTNSAQMIGGEDGAIIQGGAGIVENTGSIIATVDDGVALYQGGVVNNEKGAVISGAGTSGAGVFVTGDLGTVTNHGSIAGNLAHGVLIAAGGTLSNDGTITGFRSGVFFQKQAGTLINSGSISANDPLTAAGVYLENGGAVTNTSVGSISGARFGVFLEGAFTTLNNAGFIQGAIYDGVVLGLGGTVNNTGTIQGTTGGLYVKYRASGTVTNTGLIAASAVSGSGVDLAGGGTLDNQSGGTITGGAFGVFFGGTSTLAPTVALGTLTNEGLISASKYSAVALGAGGSVTNNAGGTISGVTNGVYIEKSAPGEVTNFGVINASSTTGAGVNLGDGGSVMNKGTISGGGFGVFATGGSGTITNPATVTNYAVISGDHGVGLQGGGSVFNAKGASIQGGIAGISSQNVAVTVDNAGSVGASTGSGLDIEAGGSIVNEASGTIRGNTFGVFVSTNAGTVSNAGTIIGVGNCGINLKAGGVVSNAAGATISGTTGIALYGASDTITNSGTVTGASNAITFAGTLNNRLIVTATGIINGNVLGSATGTSNTLELDGGSGAIQANNGNGTVTQKGKSFSFSSFGTLDVGTNGAWTLASADNTAALTDDGTIIVTGSLDVASASGLHGSGLLDLASGSALELAAASGDHTKIDFTGSGQLEIDNAAVFGSQVGTASYAGPEIHDFSTGDVIDLRNFSFSGLAAQFVNGVLQLSNSSGQKASLDLQGMSDFRAASDGKSGTLLQGGEADVFSGHGATISGTEGQALNNVVVASFTDSYTVTPAGDLLATISWGDGTSSTGTVSGGKGAFTVSGSHVYNVDGDHQVSVTLAENAPGTARATAVSTAQIAGTDFAITDMTTGQSSTTSGTVYSGPVAGLQKELVMPIADNLNVTAKVDGVFIHSGSGEDALQVHGGTNVLDGGTGSNFLVGASGFDTFFVDDRGPTADIWSTVVNFHAGDAATIWGVTPQDFALSWADNQGAAGYTGLTLHATASGQPTASLTLAGYSTADLSNGRLSVTFGFDGASGSSYMYVKAS
ncbi:MAG: S-layer family protein [Acetobacteraceae bacterium]|nr:S-layer family protein [Acetobacteraceae bacterium]